MENVVTQVDGVSIITIPDHLDVNTSPQIKNTLAEVLKTSDVIELDFSYTALVSSAGLRVLLQAQKNVQVSGKSMTLKNISSDVMEVFTLTGVTKILTIA